MSVIAERLRELKRTQVLNHTAAKWIDEAAEWIDEAADELEEARKHAEDMAAEASRLSVELERATRLIRTLCDKAPESPGCLYPGCDCGRGPG